VHIGAVACGKVRYFAIVIHMKNICRHIQTVQAAAKLPAAFAALVALAALAAGSLFSCSNRNADSVMLSGEPLRRVKAPQAYSLFAFTPAQQQALLGMQLSVTLGTVPDAAAFSGQPELKVFFYYNTKDSSHIESGPAADAGNAALRCITGGKKLMISLCLPAGTALPDGFGLYTNLPLTVQRVAAETAALGWKTDSTGEYWYFGPGGGIASGIDFTGGSSIFTAGVGTKIVIQYMPSALGAQRMFTFVCGSDTLQIRHNPLQTQTVIQAAALHSPFQQVQLQGADESTITACLMLPDPAPLQTPLQPVLTDPGLILDWDTARWRSPEYELFAWEAFPDILIFDTADYDVQDAFFKRLAFYAEKNGYKGTLQPDSVIADKHGFNALDYRPRVLASFFNLAMRQQFPLNQKELLLKQILIQNGQLIAAADGSVQEGRGAIVSVSRQSEQYQRHQLLNHECFHGIFFTHESFRTKMAELYSTMDPESLRFLIGYYTVRKELDYDTTDLDLMQNELMAYTLQHPLSATSWYYKNLAGRSNVKAGIPELSQYIFDTNAAGFVDLAQKLDAFVARSWGLNAGRVYLVSRK